MKDYTDQKLRESRHLKLALLALFVATLVISAAMILRDTGIVPEWPMDQHFADTVDLTIRKTDGRWSFHYPNLQNSGGIASSLIVGFYKLVIPTSKATLNWHIRILAMALFLGSAFWFAISMIAPTSGQILAYLLVFGSGAQFIQPSSDLFAGAFLTLGLLSFRLNWPSWLAALILAIFTLLKVEMLFAGVAIVIFWCYYKYRSGGQNSFKLAFFYFLWTALMLAPTFLIQGSHILSSNRSIGAFMSAYIDFFGTHQFTGKDVVNSFVTTPAVQEIMFPGARSFFDIITMYPRRYFDYFGVSITRSLPGIVNAIKFMIIPLAIVIINNKRLSTSRPYLIALVLATAFTLVPALVVIFIRIRYVVKLLPAMMVLATAGCLELSSRNKRFQTISNDFVVMWSSNSCLAILFFLRHVSFL